MVDSLLGSEGLWSYLLVFVLLLAGAFGLPVPEDLALIASGALIFFQRASAVPMLVVCYVGLIAGDVIIYRFGRLAGPRVFRWRTFRRIAPASRLRWIRQSLEKRTFLTILIARHLFYLRTATFLLCGAVRVHFTKFLIADMIAALITAPLMLFVGYSFANHFDTVVECLHKVRLLLVVLGAVALAALVIKYLRYRGRKVNR
jgi:membrane protein DedA with SNARE-associated domain